VEGLLSMDLVNCSDWTQENLAWLRK